MKKPIYKRPWFVVLCVIILFGVVKSMGGTNSTPSSNDSKQQTEKDSKASENKNTDSDVPKEYKNALKKAQTYSDTMHMSKAGLQRQLTSEYGENFSPEAAQYAIDHVNADYNQNALEKAKTYQDTMAMSPDRIHDQLVSSAGEQFTEEEAQYAIANLK